METDRKKASEIILGYKFFFDTAFRELLEDLAHVEEFGEADIVLQRATFKGISIEDLPNSCEKILLLKNLWYKYFEKVLTARSWRDLEKRLDVLRTRVLSKFLKLFQCWIVPEKNHSLEELYKVWSINGALVWFTDTGKGGPKPYYYGLLPIRKEYYGNNSYFMDTVFRGYAYTLQFLWYSLLGKDSFKKVPHLDKMHIAEEIFYDDCRELLALWNLGGSSEEGSKTYLKWKCLDRFFGILQEHVVEKIEEQYGVSFGISDYKLFQLNPNCSQKEFLAGLYSDKVPEPSYIKAKSSPEEWQKWLDLKFLWYPFEVLDTFGTRVFNGAIAFVYILTGMLEYR
ncbi:hypothetical protein [Thermococcus gorgonarius]|uniref:Uncharacterized protein n=1 Tax=Thermococcus gorgonarius TaxID=71997 RepID=A0A2Z2M8M7_THEGO|nr:hypothetical protein [Thermococcus gorgonarius]ASJ00234.1 hypothetical protein A3K92_01425 [Thermococcus gorgonarius]